MYLIKTFHKIIYHSYTYISIVKVQNYCQFELCTLICFVSNFLFIPSLFNIYAGSVNSLFSWDCKFTLELTTSHDLNIYNLVPLSFIPCHTCLNECLANNDIPSFPALNCSTCSLHLFIVHSIPQNCLQYLQFVIISCISTVCCHFTMAPVSQLYYSSCIITKIP